MDVKQQHNNKCLVKFFSQIEYSVDSLLLIHYIVSGDLPATDMEKISGADIVFETKRKKAAGELKPETRTILHELYSVFNHQLAALLDDKRFTW